MNEAMRANIVPMGNVHTIGWYAFQLSNNRRIVSPSLFFRV
jgi:hypothetical protein